MGRRTLRRGLVVAAVLVALAIVAFGPMVVSHFSGRTKSPPALATASLQSFPVTATASGTLLPQALVTVNFPIAGTVTEIDVHVGATVASGQLLAKLDDSEQLATLHAAQAQLAAANNAVAAASSGPSPNPNAIASAQSQVAIASAQVQRDQLEDAKTILYAPQDGAVLEINAQVGNTLNAGTTGTPGVPGSSGTIIDPAALNSSKAFMVIGQGSSLQVSATFRQADAPQLHTDQTGTLSFDALPSVSFTCHVTSVASNATVVSGISVFYAAVAPDQADPRLRVGMTANVILDIAKATDVLAVPSQAVYMLNNETYVDVWYKGKAVATRVTTGLIGDQLTEIVSGLSQGQQVVLTTQQALPSSGALPRSSPSP